MKVKERLRIKSVPKEQHAEVRAALEALPFYCEKHLSEDAVAIEEVRYIKGAYCCTTTNIPIKYGSSPDDYFALLSLGDNLDGESKCMLGEWHSTTKFDCRIPENYAMELPIFYGCTYIHGSIDIMLLWRGMKLHIYF